MQSQTDVQVVRLGRITHDAARGTFAARVDLSRDGRTFRYPSEVVAPPSADADWLSQALVAKAMSMSDTRWH
jgi:hypothetical protein